MMTQNGTGSNAVIELRHLSTGYPAKGGLKIIADDLNAEIRSGELTCLLGANGSGKSTLLRTLSGFLQPAGGDVYIKGKPLSSYKDSQLAKIIGVVLTERCAIRNMTVEELTGMGRSPYTGFWGRLSEKDMEIVSESLEIMGITHLKNRMVHTLSDGERQKVMIAKALAQQTPVIFLDEPTAFLDYPSKVEIMQLLLRLSRETGKTIFLSTHDLELALQIADTIWLMKKGEGIAIGTPEDLSLNGSLTGFFTKEGIRFDMRSGLYKIENRFLFSIELEGHYHSCSYAMMKKALQRNGIDVIPVPASFSCNASDEECAKSQSCGTGSGCVTYAADKPAGTSVYPVQETASAKLPSSGIRIRCREGKCHEENRFEILYAGSTAGTFRTTGETIEKVKDIAGHMPGQKNGKQHL